MNKILKKIHSNIFFVTSVLCAFSLLSIWLSRSTANVPHMDYWLYINSLVDKMFTQGVTFDDLYNNNGVHRAPLQLFMFLCNVRLFHYNSQIGTALGCLFTVILSFSLYNEFKKNYLQVNTGFLFNLAIVGMLSFVYSLNQWEIMCTEFYISFQVRQIAFFLSFCIINKIFKDKERYGKYVIESSIFFVFIICFLSGAYFAAYVASMMSAIIWELITNTERKKFIKEYITLISGLGIGSVLYMHGLSNVVSSGESTIFSFDFILGGFKSLVVMFGASLLGSKYNLKIVFAVGILITCLHIVCVILYFYKKIYNRSYIPVMFMIYTVCICGETYLGRGNQFGLDYMASSRYVCESIWFIIADIWILIYLMQTREKKIDIYMIMYFFGIAFLLGINLVSNIEEWRIAGYRKEWYVQVIDKIQRIDELNDDEFQQFGYDKNIIINDVEIMKKYKLGIFRYDDNAYN